MSEKKALIRALREEGLTYREIGQKCGCSAQYAWQVANEGALRRKKSIREEDCCYGAIRDWAAEHNYGVGDISFALYGRRDSSYAAQTRRMLSGSRTVYKDLIDKLLALTGLCYEEAFAVDDGRKAR